MMVMIKAVMMAYLAASVYEVELGAVLGVPETDATVSGSAAGGQEPVLVRRPGDGFHGGRVLRQSLNWLLRVLVPYQQLFSHQRQHKN